MKHLTDTATRFKALSHPTRLRILAMLRSGELCVCQIIAPLHLAPSTVSAHLSELRRAGLLEERKEGRWVRYGLSSRAEVSRLLDLVWPALEADPQVASDAVLVAELRKIPVDELCRVDLDLERLGIDSPAMIERGRSEEQ